MTTLGILTTAVTSTIVGVPAIASNITGARNSRDARNSKNASNSTSNSRDDSNSRDARKSRDVSKTSATTCVPETGTLAAVPATAEMTATV
jgi:hypothetical protein